MPFMRHVLLALMIVLLPLRGWMGDAMALEPALQFLQSQEALISGARHLDLTLDKPHFDHKFNTDEVVLADKGHCPGSAEEAIGKASPAQDPVPVCPAGCMGCDICHGMVLQHTSPEPGSLPRPAAPVPLPGQRFTSTAPAPDLKPPIS